MIHVNNLNIQQIIENGENEHFEFKKATNSFPKEALPTISAFANSDGGILILGITQENDKTYPSGISNRQKIIDDIFNILNNSQKITISLKIQSFINS